MLPEWVLHLVGAGGGGSLITLLVTKLLGRRKENADTDHVLADTIAQYQAATKTANEMTAAASAEIEKARRNGAEWYNALEAMRKETAALIEQTRAESRNEIQSLRTRNEEQAAALSTMARQLDQRTVDQAEVEWARMRNIEYEAMKAELTQLRAEVQQVPHLRAEVARLTSLLEETQREQRLDHEALRRDLDGGTAP